MKGNFHVQFLGEGVAATSPPYPTPGWATAQGDPAPIILSLQRPGHGGAVDQGGQERAEVDAAVVPPVQGQPGAAAAVRPGLQPGQLPAATGAAPVGADWTLTTLREKLIKIGAKVVRHAKAVTFQLAEVAVPRALFAAILGRIGRLRAAPSPG